MYQYSGPGSQQVDNAWNSTDDYWFMMLAQQGYIVACVDGRGTGFKGAAFKKCTQKELGKYEVEDLIDLKQRAQSENAWFLPEFIDASITQICNQFLQEAALEEWVASYPSISQKFTHKKVGIVMAGNIPMVGFHDLLSTLIAGHIAVIKLSSKDKVLMEYIVQTLKNIQPLWKDQIIIQDQLKNCDAYIATGSNNTSQYFEHYFGKFPHIIRKNKTSIAILDGTESSADLDLLSDDMVLYFGMGCRNVTQLWVPNGYSFEPLLAALKKYDFVLDNHKYKHNFVCSLESKRCDCRTNSKTRSENWRSWKHRTINRATSSL